MLMKGISAERIKFYNPNEIDGISSENQGYKACIDGYTTYRRPYTVADFRTIMETPREVTEKYHLEFINDQIIFTIKTLTYVYER